MFFFFLKELSSVIFLNLYKNTVPKNMGTETLVFSQQKCKVIKLYISQLLFFSAISFKTTQCTVM